MNNLDPPSPQPHDALLEPPAGPGGDEDHRRVHGESAPHLPQDGSEVGRNAQSFFVEPGKFGYRLVKGELDFSEPGTIEAKCTILESGSSVTVPLTALPNPA